MFGLVLRGEARAGAAPGPCDLHATWVQVYGVSLLCGVGFAMRLFVGLLAVADAPELEAETKIGALLRSLARMAAGALVPRLAPAHPSQRRAGDRLPGTAGSRPPPSLYSSSSK